MNLKDSIARQNRPISLPLTFIVFWGFLKHIFELFQKNFLFFSTLSCERVVVNLTSQVVSDYSVSHCLVTKSRPSLGSLNGFSRGCADFILRDVLAVGKVYSALEVGDGLSHGSFSSLSGFLSPLSDYIIPHG